MEKISVLDRMRQVGNELEGIVSPLAVLCIGFVHYLYFDERALSSIFVATLLCSILLVALYRKVALYVVGVFQLFFTFYASYVRPDLFLEQALFSISILAALSAMLFVESEAEQMLVHVVDDKKEKLWRELFEARQEITRLYDEKVGLTLRLEVLEDDKKYVQQEREQTEADIAKLLSDMHQMAMRACEMPEARYKQLRQQFEEKSNVLDSTRRELFYTQEEVARLKKRLEIETGVPTAYEKALLEQLKRVDEELDAQQKAHARELLGYEGLLSALMEKVRS